MGILQPPQKAGVNFTGGAYASPTDPKKSCADKQTIINMDRLSDASTVDRNMDEHMTLDEP